MGDWRHMGQGMRRRMGCPSCTMGAVSPGIKAEPYQTIGDPNMAVPVSGQMPDPESNPLPDLISGVKVDSYFQHPELVRLKHVNGGMDPALYGNVPTRSPVMAESLGPRFAVGVSVTPPVMPEASATMQNAIPIPSVAGRQSPNFQMGAVTQ